MRKNFKRVVVFFCIIALFYFSGRLYFKLNDGFTLSNIQTDFPYRDEWVAPMLTSSEITSLNHILEQPFTYLGKGAQVYAFLSNDGNYVLKIIKQKHFKIPTWQSVLSYVPGCKNYIESKNKKRQERILNLLESCKIAFEDLNEETALLYVHLNKTENLHKTTTIIDKLGIAHQLDLDHTEFLLQKKAVVLTSMIDKIMSEEKEKGPQIIHNLLHFLVNISKMGIVENDRRLTDNVGFIDDQLIFIDTGRFLKDENIKERENYQKDLVKRTQLLREWLESHHPSLLTTLEYELESID